MKTKQFFELKILRQKFTADNRRAVRQWLQKNYTANDEISQGTAAAAVILLSLIETPGDIENLAPVILASETAGKDYESLVESLGYLLSEELNAATVENLTFNRATGQIRAEFIDGKKLLVANIPGIFTPQWNAPAVVSWSRLQLISLANDLQQDHFKGEQVMDFAAYIEKFNTN